MSRIHPSDASNPWTTDHTVENRQSTRLIAVLFAFIRGSKMIFAARLGTQALRTAACPLSYRFFFVLFVSFVVNRF